MDNGLRPNPPYETTKLRFRFKVKEIASTELPGDNSEWEPPETIPNSEVKAFSADDSVRSPHVKVGHRQAPYYTKAPS